jgi:hypothetical protein
MLFEGAVVNTALIGVDPIKTDFSSAAIILFTYHIRSMEDGRDIPCIALVEL